MKSSVEVHLQASEGVDGLAVDALVTDQTSVRLTAAEHLDVWVTGSRADLHRWVLEVVQAVYAATKIASASTGLEASPPAVSPTPPAGRSFGTPI